MRQRPAYHTLALPAAIVCTAANALATPNILSVTENNGDTDRPSAKFTGQTFDIQNPNGTVLVSNYTVGLFGDGAKAMTDRVHAYGAASPTLGLPSYLIGKEYIMIANNDRDNPNLSFDVSILNPSRVYLLVDNRLGDNDASNPPSLGASGALMKWVDPANGWLPVTSNGNRAGNASLPDEVGIDENADGSINNWDSVYYKDVGAGTFTLHEMNEASRNMYGVVIAQQVPEPAIFGLLGLGLGALLLCGRRSRHP